jgi:hypothetical protein
MPTRASRLIPGFDRKAGRTEPRLSDLILGFTAVLALALGYLILLASA